MKAKKNIRVYYDITYNEYSQEHQFWLIHVDLDDKTYPISWKWNPYSNMMLSQVMKYMMDNHKHTPKYFIKS